MNEKILVAVAWPYANVALHLGHVAGAYLPPDIFARYHRLRGNDVLHVTGSDTHGTPITIRAEEEGITPEEVIERYHADQVEAFQKLGISFDLFTHTDTENHWAVTTDMFTTLARKRLHLPRHTARAVLRPLRQVAARPLCRGHLPPLRLRRMRAATSATTAAQPLDALELVEPRCKFCGAMPEIRETEHFFLDLGKANAQPLEWVSDGKDHWRPNVRNFTMQAAQSGELRGRPSRATSVGASPCRWRDLRTSASMSGSTP